MRGGEGGGEVVAASDVVATNDEDEGSVDMVCIALSAVESVLAYAFVWSGS